MGEEITWDTIDRTITLTEAAKLLRMHGRTPHLGSVRRWADPRRGYRPRGYTGPAAILKTLRVGQAILTLPEWVREFAEERLRLGLEQDRPAVPARSPRAQAAGHRRAEAELDRAGVGTRKR